jgi:hypothetical protein
MDDKDRKDVLSEALFAELQAIRENTDKIPRVEQRLSSVEYRLENVELKLDIVSQAVKDHIHNKSLHS